MTKIAVMQPTFIPWMGYFALIASVDAFVFLDDVQFSKQSWQSRNRIKSPSGALTLSVPISRQDSKPLILDTKLASEDEPQKIRKSIAANLAKSPHVKEVLDLLSSGFGEAHGYLCDLNIGMIKNISRKAGFSTAFYRSSNMGIVEDSKVKRIINICEKHGADIYVSPAGSFEYLQQNNQFPESSVELRFLTFEHPSYSQCFGDFLPYMSSIDAIANLGWSGFHEAVIGGVAAEKTIEELKESINEPI